jgi:hypothetical protein
MTIVHSVLIDGSFEFNSDDIPLIELRIDDMDRVFLHPDLQFFDAVCRVCLPCVVAVYE